MVVLIQGVEGSGRTGRNINGRKGTTKDERMWCRFRVCRGQGEQGGKEQGRVTRCDGVDICLVLIQGVEVSGRTRRKRNE